VDSITSTPQIITLQTSQASLTQAISNGYSTGNRMRLGPPKLASKCVSVAGTSTKGAIWDRVEWNLSGKVIYQDDIVTIDLPTAVFAFDPMLEIDWTIEGAQLEYFRAEAGGDFIIDLSARVNAQIDEEWDKEIPIPGTQYQQVYVQWTPTIPPIPIVEVVTFELIARAHLDGNVFATIEPGFSYTLPVRVGAEYTGYNDTWREIRSPIPSDPIARLDWQASGDVSARVSIAPTIKVEFYAVAGPNFAIEPYLSFDGNIVLNPLSCNYQLDAGVDALLGFYFGIFDYTFIDHQFPPWNLYNKTLLKGDCTPPSQGTITIDVTPDSGSWQLTGPAGFSTVTGTGDRLGGSAITGAPEGAYTLTCYDNVAGYDPPSPITRTLSSGSTIKFEPVYTETLQTGTIEIDVFPNAGSWKLEGPPGFTTINGSGDRKGSTAIRNAPSGGYTLSCNNNVSGYNPPGAQNKTLVAGGNLPFAAWWTPEGLPGTIEMVYVPSGTFTMGARDDGDDGTYAYSDEYPRHEVTLSAYYIGKYEITNGQYCAVLNWAKGMGYLENSSGGSYTGGDVYKNGSILLDIDYLDCQITYSGGSFTCKIRDTYSMENHPVVLVSWYGSVAFCNWLSEKEGKSQAYNLSTWELVNKTGGGYRLPTEAEWERAAAWDGSKHWIYGYTSDNGNNRNQYNHYDNLGGTGNVNPLGLSSYPYTSPVGWFNGVNISPNGSIQTIDSPSPVGCYDMSGNVWEWRHDWYSSTYYQGGVMTDPNGPASGSHRVFRGGYWIISAQYCRSALRDGDGAPSITDNGIGFRVCLQAGGS
jgi:formylglycine-generating enzyme required for sulfatase activity